MAPKYEDKAAPDEPLVYRLLEDQDAVSDGSSAASSHFTKDTSRRCQFLRYSLIVVHILLLIGYTMAFTLLKDRSFCKSKAPHQIFCKFGLMNSFAHRVP